MDFLLNDDQRALAEGVRSYCTDVWTPDALRAASEAPAVDRARWRDLAGMGIFDLRLGEADGGSGLGLADAAVVFEELGRACVPGPLLACHLAAGLVPGVADGSRIVGLVERSGPVVLVEHLASLDAVLVLGDDEVELVQAAALAGVEVELPVDPLTPLHRVVALPSGERLGGRDLADALRRDGTILTAAFEVGLAQGALDLALAYARQRRQFDRVIGSMQAVKHLLADMLVRVELARSITLAAAVTADDPEVGDVVRATSAAKLMADEAATVNGRSGIQVHGGMGFTWEVLAHFFLKRAWVLETHFGSANFHAEQVAATV